MKFFLKMLKTYLLIILTLLSTSSGFSQDKYWIFFEENDCKVDDYTKILQSEGLTITQISRWLKAVVVEEEHSRLEDLCHFPFIKNYRKVKKLPTETHRENALGIQSEDYLRQLEMLRLDALHANGFTGKGIKIAVFDNGFGLVDSLQGFDHLFHENRILQTRDFVDPGESALRNCSRCKHGTEVLSVLAAKMPGQLMGAAPDAEYILLRTENSYSETHVEEDLFVAAVEYAESLGARIFNISYGFRDFDPGEGDYSQNDMDGNTALITRVADMAAARGILVVASAGNLAWKGITAPSDGDSVLAIGGVDRDGDYYFESSQGPSADGRVKPDLAAMGEGVSFLRLDGEIGQGNGTSLSAPLITGLAACLWQADPSAGNMDIYRVLQESASQYLNPDEYTGYGIPDGQKALTFLNPDIFFDPNLTYLPLFEENVYTIFPNPNKGTFYVVASPDLVSFSGECRVFDQNGKLCFSEKISLSRTKNQHRVHLPKRKPGIYYIGLTDSENSAKFSAKKILVLKD